MTVLSLIAAAVLIALAAAALWGAWALEREARRLEHYARIRARVDDYARKYAAAHSIPFEVARATVVAALRASADHDPYERRP